MSADRNLLFGILAVHLDFASPDELVRAMSNWLLDKSKPLGDILRDQGCLSPGRLLLLTALVDEHLNRHGGNVEQSLAALSSAERTARHLVDALPDGDARQTLQQALPAPGTPRSTDPPSPIRYRVLRPHKKGGLGEVYVAEDIELGRHVALKEIQGHHADDAANRSRFVLEAEITGGLEHPGIVPVYGLGTYADGRPFYAMRFIQGDNLHEAIRRFHGNALSPTRQRGDEATPLAGASGSRDFTSLAFRDLLRRFIDVCNAVAYAHSRGVLHRDLKPGNIMLGKFGETLVVDWGLAKATGRAGSVSDRSDSAALQPRSGGDSSATVVGQALGTPAYMSPEQADGRAAELGPATDVYSLGATLYEVLTGRAPIQGVTQDEWLKRVQSGRFDHPRAVRPAVPPALEAVCLKAMALAPAERYASALDVAKEVERFLADEPVAVYPEPLGTRARRWVRRHARLVTAIGIALLVGSAALGLLAWQREQARRAVAVARARAREAFDTMVSGVAGDALTAQAALSEEQAAFLRNVLAYYEEFAAEPGDDRAGRERLAAAHQQLGWIRYRLGQRDDGVAVYRRAVELYEGLVADYPGVAEYRKGLALSRNRLGALLTRLGRRAEAEAEYRGARAAFEALAVEHPNVADYRRELALCRYNLAGLYADLLRRPEAQAEYRAAMTGYQTLVNDHPDVPDYQRELALCHNNLGGILRILGQWEEAEKELRTAQGLQERLVDAHPNVPDYRRDLGRSHISTGNLLANRHQLPRAEVEYRTAQAVYEKLVAERPGVPDYRADLARSHTNLATVLIVQSKLPEAEAEFHAARAGYEALVASYPTVPEYRGELAQARNNFAEMLSRIGQGSKAEAEFRATLAAYEALVANYPDVPEYRYGVARSCYNLGHVLAGLDRTSDAEAQYRAASNAFEALTAKHPAMPDYRQGLARSRTNLGHLLSGPGGNLETAATEYRVALAVWEKLVADFPTNPAFRSDLARCHTNLAVALDGSGKRGEAEAEYRTALTVQEKLVEEHPQVPDLRQDFGRTLVGYSGLLARQGKARDAAATAEKALTGKALAAVMLYDCACAFALASAAAGNPDAERHAGRAVELLRQAVAAGYRDVPHLLQDADLAALRRRDDYAALLWELADGPR